MGDHAENGFFRFGPYQLNPTARVLMRGNDIIAIGSRAFDILVALVQRKGQVLSRRDLMAFAWPGLNVEDSNVRVQMAQLRREIGCGENGKRYIASVSGRGYSFVARVEWQETSEESEALWGEEHITHGGERIPGLPSLPPRLGQPVGRDENIAELSRMVGERRFVTVVGAGGVGKTTLAILVAHALPAFQRVYFVDLSTSDDAPAAIDAVASALDVPRQTGKSIARIAGQLSARRSLVILDNCEHVIDAVAEIIGPLLEQAATVHILATSRESFRLPGEAVYLLRPLGVPPNTGRLTAEKALFWPAIQLFVKRAVESGCLEPFGDHQAGKVAAICRRLDGNPLAIELVASRIGPYGLDRVAELLDNQLALWWRGSRYATPRHQTAEAMMDWSYALLSDTDQRVFRRLSVFSGEFSLDAAVAVLEDDDFGHADIVEAIGNLIDKSLLSLHTRKGSAQLKLSGIVKTYAAFKLLESGERAVVDQRQTVHHMQPPRQRAAKAGAACDSEQGMHMGVS